uniref:GAG-pre-integrase domain-containing protein n=1 Tax=Cannabis sativa TaxID=3483 RepID=A0A803QJ02_CANSA
MDKFNGSNDLSLWRIKMKALLVHQGIVEAIDEKLLDGLKDEKIKRDTETKTHSAILLSLRDEVLREVNNGVLTVTKGSKIALEGRLYNGLYYFDGKTIQGNTFPVVSQDETNMIKLWHIKLGHVSERGFLELNKQGLFKKGSSGKLNFCEECVIDKAEIEALKAKLKERFEMKDLSAAKRILGMDIIRERPSYIKLSQKSYLKKILEKFGMEDAKPVIVPLAQHFRLTQNQTPHTDEKRKNMEKATYISCVGSLAYAMVCTRPDLAYSMSIVSRFLTDPGNEHWSALKWIMSIDTRRSLTGYVFTFLGGCISWKSNLQKVVILSSIEAEYMAATEAIKEAIWLKGLAKEFGLYIDGITMYCDNQSVLHPMKNPMFYERSKHIVIKLHFIRDIIAKKEVFVKKVHTYENPTDLFTKSVATLIDWFNNQGGFVMVCD